MAKFTDQQVRKFALDVLDDNDNTLLRDYRIGSDDDDEPTGYWIPMHVWVYAEDIERHRQAKLDRILSERRAARSFSKCEECQSLVPSRNCVVCEFRSEVLAGATSL